jgi:hypothetical protein
MLMMYHLNFSAGSLSSTLAMASGKVATQNTQLPREHSTATPRSSQCCGVLRSGMASGRCIRKLVLCPALLSTPARAGVL